MTAKKKFLFLIILLLVAGTFLPAGMGQATAADPQPEKLLPYSPGNGIVLANNCPPPNPCGYWDGHRWHCACGGGGGGGNPPPSPTPTPRPPTISGTVTCEQAGENGWCVKNEKLVLNASDPQGYAVTVSGDLNGTTFSCGASCTLDLPKGRGTANYMVTSSSGRTASGSSAWKFDPDPPTTTISYPSANSVVKGAINITGQSTDAVSRVYDTQISFDVDNWTSFSSSVGDWSFPWDTASLPNGPFTIYAKSIDLAGNVASPTQVSVILDNHPPHLTVPPAWTLPQSGGLSVAPNVTPLKNVQITIQDPFGRFRDRVLFDGLPAPQQITWDGAIRHMLASPGSYPILVQACDIYDLCAETTSLIVVPAPTPTATPSPTPRPSPISPPPAITSTLVPTSTAAMLPTQIFPTPLPVLKQETPPPSRPMWPIAFPGLFLFMFTVLLLFDPRPAALRKLSRTIHHGRKGTYHLGVKNVRNRTGR